MQKGIIEGTIEWFRGYEPMSQFFILLMALAFFIFCLYMAYSIICELPEDDFVAGKKKPNGGNRWTDEHN